jgi:Ca2+/H+ antiporter
LQTAALVNAGLLLMALMGMLLPAVLYATHTELRDGTSELFLSRFSSVVMLIAYGAYLFFQLKSHRELYSEKPDVGNCSGRAVEEQLSERGGQLDVLESGHVAVLNGHVAELRPLDGHVEDLRSNGHGEKDSSRQTTLYSHHGSDVSNPDAIRNPILNPGLNPNCPLCCPHGKPLPNPNPCDVLGMAAASGDVSKEEEEEEESVLGFWGSIVWLALITVLIAVLSDRLVATLQGAAQALNISVAFISVIVLPIVGNAAEHASAVLFAYRNRLVSVRLFLFRFWSLALRESWVPGFAEIGFSLLAFGLASKDEGRRKSQNAGRFLEKWERLYSNVGSGSALSIWGPSEHWGDSRLADRRS